MDHTIIQGTMKARGKFKFYHKYRYDSYNEALKVFNDIKDNSSSYELKKNESLVTVMYDEKSNILELYKSYRKREKR